MKRANERRQQAKALQVARARKEGADAFACTVGATPCTPLGTVMRLSTDAPRSIASGVQREQRMSNTHERKGGCMDTHHH